MDTLSSNLKSIVILSLSIPPMAVKNNVPVLCVVCRRAGEIHYA